MPLLILIVAAGVLTRLCFATINTRVWIDEIWVVLSPAYKLLSGVGPIDRDWVWQVRDWLPPSLLFCFLKFLDLIGIKDGPTTQLIVRLEVSALTSAAIICYSFHLKNTFKLKLHPYLPLLVLFFIPELIHYSGTADLSVLGIPILLFGITLYFDGFSKLKKRIGASLILLSTFIRFQFAVFPATFFLIHLYKKEYKKAFELAITAALVITVDITFNSIMYGKPVWPFWNYFLVNTSGGVASSYGTTSPLHGIEIFWRFATEPVLLLCILFAPMAIKRAPFLAISSYIFLIIHLLIPHKEYRFFYGAVVMLAGLSAACLQDYGKKRVIATFLILFAGFVLFRGIKKVDFRAYEVPALLEAKAGTDPLTTGLITFGWGGIYQGCNYFYFRPLPCIFGENLTQVKDRLKENNLDGKSFSHVVMSENENAKSVESLGLNCNDLIEKKNGAALYRCNPLAYK